MKKEDYISLINYGVQSPTCKKRLLELVDKYFELEKALDKACAELEKWDIKNFDNIQVTKEEWKEWCMKDE